MIQHGFQLLERVGGRTERRLWRSGITSWERFLRAESVERIPAEKKSYFDRKLHAARKALLRGDSSYFLDKVASTETWRLYPFFREEAVFLDIETDGTGASSDITVVGLFDGLRTKTMIRDVNLDYPALREELSRYKLIITFNGSSFDLPFIRKRYDILPPVPHIDLRHCCARLGLEGGLKDIERQLGITRRSLVDRMQGGDALTLWRMYRATGDEHYLQLLVEYNEEDVFNLRKIMHHCYAVLRDRMLEEMAFPFSSPPLPLPPSAPSFSSGDSTSGSVPSQPI